MEQDLERSEEKVELSERFVPYVSLMLNCIFCIKLTDPIHVFFSPFYSNEISNPIFKKTFSSRSKIVELEEELRVVGNNLKSLEVSEEKVRTIQKLFIDFIIIFFWRTRFSLIWITKIKNNRIDAIQKR